MAGIAGIARRAKVAEVNRMLDAVSHRGRQRQVFEANGFTLGVNYPDHDKTSFDVSQAVVRDGGCCRYAQAQIVHGHIMLLRDPVGIAPLYYGHTNDGALCFASEVKALLQVGSTVNELPPGSFYDGAEHKQHFRLQPLLVLTQPSAQLARTLLNLLRASVQRCASDNLGAWLSGGLDSSALVAIARPMTRRLHTFAAGVAESPDLKFARLAADFLKTDHHEVILNHRGMIKILPDVIFHLESFDALLVRSSIMNYAASKVASDHVSTVLSGEGGDELFAGYQYLKELPAERLAEELLDITGRLHNTALQRVDRSSSAHGLTPCVCFLDSAVIQHAMTIPVEFKLRGGVEKWILRQAVAGLLPDSIINRPKAKFWQGAGVGELLAQNADKQISDADFHSERTLPNGWLLNSKEELLYYRVFHEQFGEIPDLSWMGRTKGSPCT